MMEGWKNYCLKEIIDEFIMGQSPDSSSYNNEEKGIAFIQGNADMQNGVPSIRMFTTDPKRYSELNDILLSVRAPVGDVFYNNYGNLSIGRGLSAIRIKNKHLRTLVYYWLNFDKKQFERLEQGTTFTEIGKKEVRNINVTIPTNSKEQAYIANILSSVDEAIESVKKSIEAAEKLKKSLMQNLLTGRMKHDGTLRTEEEFYEDEKFGKVPIGWEVKMVKKCFKFKNGKGNTTSNLKQIPDEVFCIPVFGGNGVTGYYHTALLNEPTIIVGRVGEYCGNVFKTPEKSWVTDNAMLVSEVLMQDYDIDFFTMKLNSLNFKQYSDSTGQPKITQGSIGNVLFAYPENVKEQNNIILSINNISNNIKCKQSKIITLERLKKSLMQNLLTGKVRVGEEGKEKI